MEGEKYQKTISLTDLEIACYIISVRPRTFMASK